jgi:hypothetical protein
MWRVLDLLAPRGSVHPQWAAKTAVNGLEGAKDKRRGCEEGD